MTTESTVPSVLRQPANWARNVIFRAARAHHPTSVAQLQRIVAEGRGVHAVGTGHSFSAVADADYDLVRLDALPGFAEIDTVSRTVTVPAGLTYADLAGTLHRAGFALANLASHTDLSVAGACATGTHGSGDQVRGLGAAVTGMELVGGDGDLFELSRQGNPGVFPGAVVHLGALGIVTRLTMAIEPSYEVRQQVRTNVPLDECAQLFADIFGSGYSVSLFTDWRSGEASAWIKNRTDQPRTGWEGGRPAAVAAHPVPGKPAQGCTSQLNVPGPWHERLPHFRPGTVGTADELQSEFFLPRDQGPAAIERLRRIAGQVSPFLQVSELRTVRGDDLWLSPAYGRDSVTIHFTWVSDATALGPALAAVQEQLLPLGARPHWGKLTTAPPAAIAASYERWPEFESLRKELDPGSKFANSFIRQFLADEGISGGPREGLCPN